MSAAESLSRPLSAWRLAVYAAPVIGTTALLTPVASIVPGIYAKYFGLSLSSIAAVTLAVRSTDAVLDPLIGHLSDRASARTGSRRPFIIAGAMALLISSWFLVTPPTNPGPLWFAGTLLACYLSWSLFEIPHTAWGAELASGYTDRARLFGSRVFAYYIGSLLFYVLPLLHILPTTEITPETLRLALACVTLIIVPSIVGTIWLRVSSPAGPRRHERRSAGMLRSIVSNRPLLLFLAAYLLAGLGLGMWSGLLFICVDSYFGLAPKVAFVFAVSTPLAIVATPLWYRIVTWTGKRSAWAVSMAGCAVVVFAFGLLPRGDAAFLPLVFLVCFLMLASACQGVVAPAILADISDYGEWRFRKNLTGTYYAVFALVTKATVSLGSAAGFAAAGFFGFDPKAGVQTTKAVLGMKVAFAFVPAALIVASLPFILATPIDARRQAVLRKRIERRSTRSQDDHGVHER